LPLFFCQTAFSLRMQKKSVSLVMRPCATTPSGRRPSIDRWVRCWADYLLHASTLKPSGGVTATHAPTRRSLRSPSRQGRQMQMPAPFWSVVRLLVCSIVRAAAGKPKEVKGATADAANSRQSTPFSNRMCLILYFKQPSGSTEKQVGFSGLTIELPV
jgi:hypothetical protein